MVGNRRAQAVAPIEGLSEDKHKFWKQQYYGLLVSLDPTGMHAAASRRAALALRYYDTAQSHLANLSTLDVRGLAFCSRVESFGRYDEFRTYNFRAGQEVLLYVEVEHFAAEKQGDQFETELQGEYEILDAQGMHIANVVLPHNKQLCNNRRRDYFIAYKLLPSQGNHARCLLATTDDRRHQGREVQPVLGRLQDPLKRKPPLTTLRVRVIR